MSNPTVFASYHLGLFSTMLFRIGEKEYSGTSALDIVDALKCDMPEGEQKHVSVREFILWSMLQLSDRIPLRELDVSDKLSNEMLALNYLLLRDEYGAGTLSGIYIESKANG